MDNGYWFDPQCYTHCEWFIFEHKHFEYMNTMRYVFTNGMLLYEILPVFTFFLFYLFLFTFSLSGQQGLILMVFFSGKMCEILNWLKKYIEIRSKDWLKYILGNMNRPRTGTLCWYLYMKYLVKSFVPYFYSTQLYGYYYNCATVNWRLFCVVLLQNLKWNHFSQEMASCLYSTQSKINNNFDNQIEFSRNLVN